MAQWLQIHRETLEKPEMLRIAQHCRISIEQALVGCLRVWFWFDTHTRDGRHTGGGVR